MNLDMVFNELSLQNPASDQQTARGWMTQFIQTLSMATRNGVGRILRSHAEFHSTELAPGYLLQQWRNDPEVEIDERRFLKSLTHKVPYLSDLPQIEQDSFLSEFRYDNVVALGLGYAFFLDSFAISLPTASQWDCEQIEIEHSYLKDDESISTDKVFARHCCHPNHIAAHRDWITQRLKASIDDGTDIWNRRTTLFPSLIFCDDVEAQLRELSSGNPLLYQTVKRLFEFENHCADWHEGSFNPDLFPSKLSPESPATIKQYGTERTFLCPDGTKRTFSWHVRLTPGAWRLHFYPEAKNYTIIIGYIGPHLPTVNDPT